MGLYEMPCHRALVSPGQLATSSASVVLRLSRRCRNGCSDQGASRRPHAAATALTASAGTFSQRAEEAVQQYPWLARTISDRDTAGYGLRGQRLPSPA
jgi:hypothetical protein